MPLILRRTNLRQEGEQERSDAGRPHAVGHRELPPEDNARAFFGG